MKYIVTLNGKSYEVEVNETDAVITNVSTAAGAAPAPVAAPVAAPIAAPIAAPAPAAAPAKEEAPAPAPVAAPSADGKKVVAPMPGTVLKVLCSVGQAVKAGDTLFILEAMKMENEITAECDGVVKQILVGSSTVVNTDDVLAVI
ncbi:MAG: biotin/lipoyl-binding protein [Clostridia bacterium]|nr:biotin/lipoyl-binding protein [Clostridia bacterium]